MPRRTHHTCPDTCPTQNAFCVSLTEAQTQKRVRSSQKRPPSLCRSEARVSLSVHLSAMLPRLLTRATRARGRSGVGRQKKWYTARARRAHFARLRSPKSRGAGAAALADGARQRSSSWLDGSRWGMIDAGDDERSLTRAFSTSRSYVACGEVAGVAGCVRGRDCGGGEG